MELTCRNDDDDDDEYDTDLDDDDYDTENGCGNQYLRSQNET